MVNASPVMPQGSVNQNHLNNFNALRLLLAVMVMFGHFKGLPGNDYTLLYSYADFAIHAFFIVSGYLIAMSYANGSDTINFYIRRVFRIYPLYAVIILTQAVIMLAFLGDWAAYLKDAAWYVFANMMFANFLAYDIGGLLSDFHNKGINASLWTLKIEMGFYIILPLVWVLLKRFGIVLVAAVFVLASAYHFYFEGIERLTLAKQLPGQMRFFIIGIALYMWRDKINISTLWAVVIAVGLFVACTIFRHDMWFDVIYPLVIGLWVFVVAMRLPAKPIHFDFSYGVYLLHAPLIQISILLGIFSDSLLYLAGLSVCVFILAFLAEVGIEKPGIALGKYITKKRKEAKAQKVQQT